MKSRVATKVFGSVENIFRGVLRSWCRCYGGFLSVCVCVCVCLSFLFVCPVVKIPIPFPVICVFASSHKSITRAMGWLSCFGTMTARGRGYWCYVGSNGNSNTECSTCEKCSANYLKASSETIFVSRRQMWLGEPSEVNRSLSELWKAENVLSQN